MAPAPQFLPTIDVEGASDRVESTRVQAVLPRRAGRARRHVPALRAWALRPLRCSQRARRLRDRRSADRGRDRRQPRRSGDDGGAVPVARDPGARRLSRRGRPRRRPDRGRVLGGARGRFARGARAHRAQHHRCAIDLRNGPGRRPARARTSRAANRIAGERTRARRRDAGADRRLPAPRARGRQRRAPARRAPLDARQAGGRVRVARTDLRAATDRVLAVPRGAVARQP